MARQDGFELPTTWFEASYLFTQFSAQPCGFLEIKFLGNSEIQGDNPSNGNIRLVVVGT